MSDRVAFKCPDCGETVHASVGAYKGHGGGFNYPPEPDEIREIFEIEFDCGCDLKHGYIVEDDKTGASHLRRFDLPQDVEWWGKVEDLVMEGPIDWDDDYDDYGLDSWGDEYDYEED